jgi:hypothetical protein
MEYTIVKAKTVETIIRNVVAMMDAGWSPCGGLAFGKETWAQAMTRDRLSKALHHKDNGTGKK